MSNEDRKRLRAIVDNLARENNRAYRRQVQAAWRRRRGSREIPQTANRLPEETVHDYVQHALPYWQRRDLPRVKQALSHAPAGIREEAIRELAAMVRAT